MMPAAGSSQRFAKTPSAAWCSKPTSCAKATSCTLLLTAALLVYLQHRSHGTGLLNSSASPLQPPSALERSSAAADAAAIALPCMGAAAFHLGGHTTAVPVYLLPDLVLPMKDSSNCLNLTAAALSQSTFQLGHNEAVAGARNGAVRFLPSLAAAPVLQRHRSVSDGRSVPPAQKHLAGYQKRNLRNYLMLMKAILTGDVTWDNMCTDIEADIDCQVHAPGAVNELLKEPLTLGNVLDYGADPSGAQLLELTRYTSAFSVGYNIYGDPGAFAASDSTAFVWGAAGERLPFPAATFDHVMSLNIMEHVQNLQLYIAEAARVLKARGYFYMSWKPSWQSRRGHHVHDDVVQDMAASLNCGAPPYENNGSTIPDWSHLLLSEGEFLALLEASHLGECSGLPKQITHFVYRNADLNRRTYEDVTAALKAERELEFVRVSVAEEEAAYPLTAKTWKRLRRKMPGSEHFRISEARLVLRRVDPLPA